MMTREVPAASVCVMVTRSFRARGEKAGLIWLDAHADMNTPESSPSGNIHGMPLACILGHGPAALTDMLGYRPKVDPHNTVIVGLRDVDAGATGFEPLNGLQRLSRRCTPTHED